MKCRTCGSTMVVDHRESGSGATTRWLSCPLCHTKRMTSEPDTLSAIGSPADDDNRYAGEPAPAGIDADLET